MPLEVSVGSEADADIDGIFLYLASYSESAAVRFLSNASETFQFLAENPLVGRIRERPEADLVDVRQWAVRDFRNYLIFYQLRDEVLLVLRVVHGARDLTGLRLGPDRPGAE
jgi:toxin ParE1/3/4